MRMTTHRTVASILGAVLLLAGGEATRAQAAPPGPDDFVLTEKNAVLLDAPDLVAQGVVRRAEWSRTGKHVLAVRERLLLAQALQGAPNPREVSVVLWDRAGRQSREVWKSRGPQDEVHETQWLPGTDTALFVVEQTPLAPKPAPGARPSRPERWLVRLDARRSATRALTRLASDSRLMVSTSRPLAAVFSAQGKSLGLVSADGVTRDVSPALAGRTVVSIDWEASGTRLLLQCMQELRDGKAQTAWYPLDPTTGRVEAALATAQVNAELTAPQSDGAGAEFRLRSGAATLQEKQARRQVRPLWLESAHPGERSLTLVSADGTGASLSAKGDAVLYLSEGAAWVRQFIPMSRPLFETARAEAERARLMSAGKQVGLGLIVYASEHDETLPAPGSDIGAIIQPYTNNGELAQGFVYVFPGGKLTDVSEPHKTLLGYIPTPGGRVQVFLDGHVTFAQEMR